VGWKTAILAYAVGNPADCLRAPGELDPDATNDFVSCVHPDWSGTTVEGSAFLEALYPPEGVAFAGSFPAAQILCDQEVMVDRPSELPAHLVELGNDRTMILHVMHNAVDFLAYGLWEDGELVRSLSMDRGSGIIENIGNPLPFEEPFWAGEHSIGDGYPLPFHPLELGESAALPALLGVNLGRPASGDVGLEGIRLNGYQVPVANPITEEDIADFIRMHHRRRYRLGPGGQLIEVDEPLT
jgi:hypothetical protein